MIIKYYRKKYYTNNNLLNNYNNYKFIINPFTGEKYLISSKKGRELIKKYIQYYFANKNKVFYYYCHNISKKNKKIIKKILADKRGWAGKGYFFEEINNLYKAKIQIYFKTNKQINKLFNNHVNLKNLSVTDRSTNPISIYFNTNNWYKIPKPFKSSLKKYREYLVQHEFGHAIGYNHVERPPKNSKQLCNPMLQQTLHTKPYCIPNPWITKVKLPSSF